MSIGPHGTTLDASPVSPERRTVDSGAVGKVSLDMSGVIVTAASVVVVVAGVAVVPGGGANSFFGALAIAAGFAGAGYGILRMSRSGGAAERADRESAVDRARAQRRARWAVRVQSVLFLVLGVASGAVHLFSAPGREPSTLRFGLLGAALIVLGIGGLIVAARAGRLRPESDPAPEPRDGDASETPDAREGWQLITRRDPLSLITIAAPGAGVVVFLVWQSSSLLLQATQTLTAGAAVSALVVAVAVVVIVVVAVVRKTPRVWVDVAAQRVRCGSRVVSWDEITAARLSGTGTIVGGARSLVLTLECPAKLRIPLILRRRGELAMTPRERETAVALIEGASIAVPRAPEDPTGKFSNVYYPSHLDAQQARDLVARPPRSDEDLPVTPG